MKFLKYFLLIICSVNFFILANDDEEVKTIEIDGVIYKVNTESFNISPYDNEIMTEAENLQSNSDVLVVSEDEVSNEDDNTKGYDISINTGLLFPLSDSENYDSGSGIGFSIDLPKEITLFGNTFSTGVELNFGSLGEVLVANDSAWDVDHCTNGGVLLDGVCDNSYVTNETNLNSVIFTMGTELDEIPLGIDIGFAFTDHSYYGMTGSGLLDLSYKLPFEKADLSLVLRLQKVVDVSEDYELDFGAQDLYGIYLKYGRTLSF